MGEHNISNATKAKVLVDALPYIKKYYNKIIVVKYGGNAMINDKLKDAVMRDIVYLSLIGIKVVLVHGGGPDINKTLDKMGIESKFVNGLRYTDEETAKVVQMVLAGSVNKNLVSLLNNLGGKAIGLCGMDAKLIKVKKLENGDDLGFVGDIEKVNCGPILDVLEKGYIPVIATVSSDKNGNVYNINADTAASKIASALKAENLILMTDIKGLLSDKNDENSLIPVVNVSEVPHLKRQNIISGGMIPKVECCVEAVRQGVKKTFIIDGRVEHSILIEMFSNEGIGTMFK